jgi:aminopeptidase N
LFLKEGFASWLGALKCGDHLHPERRFTQSFVAQTVLKALASDSTRHTHPIIDDKAQTLLELENTYDDICYEKGSTVVAMLAEHIGLEAFVKGIRRYLNKGNAVAGREELWQAMDDGKNDFSSFARKWVATEGYPVVKIEEAEHGYFLHQERFLRTGDLKPEEDTALW